MATKKETPKPVKAAAKRTPVKETKSLVKEEVSYKQTGRNLNITIGNQKFTRVGDKEDLTLVKDAIKAYDEKPIKANYDKMMKIVRPVSTEKAEQKELLETKIKGQAVLAKKSAKEEKTKRKTVVKDVVEDIDNKDLSEKELEELQQAINRQKAKQQPKVFVAPRRSGEH